ncbi:MAG TPA: FxsA family protein [Solirubrobacterales bacterium]|nr:FxsA family protein [Solirubrobacterales bacterium]
MGLLLVLVFIVLPIAEIYVIIKVGEAIGAVPTIALLIGDAFLGAALLRSQGRAAWRRFNQALAEGRVPGREIFDGAMVILGGAFLLTPGFITDVIGVLLLLPPTRAAFRGAIARMARRRTTFTVRWGSGQPPGPPGGGDPAGRARGRYDYEGSAREVGDADRELPGERRDDGA